MSSFESEALKMLFIICCDKAHDDIFNTNIVFYNEMNVNVEEMKKIDNDLACNKSPGLDRVSAEHMTFAGPISLHYLG